uniref:Uncharacterized protein n=1 Tax=Candidatus Kentrum sp. TC TaxID=2126339 RepID=A0A450YRN3_9GAMM|nr:MAG: hypothetical protein BECKTC1821E_GA0114239_103216 [Candidatus Kentron sp. TC]
MLLSKEGSGPPRGVPCVASPSHPPSSPPVDVGESEAGCACPRSDAPAATSGCRGRLGRRTFPNPYPPPSGTLPPLYPPHMLLHLPGDYRDLDFIAAQMWLLRMRFLFIGSGVLPSVSFVSHLAVGALAVRLTVPVTRVRRELSAPSHFPGRFRLPVTSATHGASRHAWRTMKKPHQSMGFFVYALSVCFCLHE